MCVKFAYDIKLYGISETVKDLGLVGDCKLNMGQNLGLLQTNKQKKKQKRQYYSGTY